MCTRRSVSACAMLIGVYVLLIVRFEIQMHSSGSGTMVYVNAEYLVYDTGGPVYRYRQLYVGALFRNGINHQLVATSVWRVLHARQYD